MTPVVSGGFALWLFSSSLSAFMGTKLMLPRRCASVAHPTLASTSSGLIVPDNAKRCVHCLANYRCSYFSRSPGLRVR